MGVDLKTDGPVDQLSELLAKRLSERFGIRAPQLSG